MDAGSSSPSAQTGCGTHAERGGDLHEATLRGPVAQRLPATAPDPRAIDRNGPTSRTSEISGESSVVHNLRLFCLLQGHSVFCLPCPAPSAESVKPSDFAPRKARKYAPSAADGSAKSASIARLIARTCFPPTAMRTSTNGSFHPTRHSSMSRYLPTLSTPTSS